MGKSPRLDLSSHISARLTLAERKLVASAADRAGLTTSQWARSIIVNALCSPIETRALMAEFLALRAVILTLHANVAQGRKYTPEMIEALLAQADEAKFRLADQRLADAIAAPLAISLETLATPREGNNA